MSGVLSEVDGRLDDAGFSALSRLVRAQLGIELPPQKRPLAAERLRKLAAARGIPSVKALLEDHLTGAPDKAFLSDLANALSTNHTHFWREHEHLVLYRDRALPERMATRRQDRDLRVWCAASATGEEPWTLTILLDQVLGGQRTNWQAGVLATDVSARALEIAQAGEYRTDNVERLPADLRRHGFDRQDTDTWRVKAGLRPLLLYRRFNLMREPYPFRVPFDVIFCRNVMIYFDDRTRFGVLQRLLSVLQPGGWLFVGHAETVPSRELGLQGVQPGVFRKPGGAP